MRMPSRKPNNSSRKYRISQLQLGHISRFGCKNLVGNFEQAGHYRWPMLWFLDASTYLVYCTNARCICDIVMKRTVIQKGWGGGSYQLNVVCVGGLAADADISYLSCSLK